MGKCQSRGCKSNEPGPTSSPNQSPLYQFMSEKYRGSTDQVTTWETLRFPEGGSLSDRQRRKKLEIREQREKEAECYDRKTKRYTTGQKF